MTDPVEDIIGDYKAFAAQQRDRLLSRGIDITPFTLSHICYRVAEWDEYVRVRGLLERHAVANRESVWNGRPMSLIVFDQLEVLDGKTLPMIELIPPVHQRVYKMGLEHLGIVVGEMFDAFVDAAKARGFPVELRWCPDSGHNAPAGMPAEVCRDDYGSWLRDFFGRALSTEP